MHLARSLRLFWFFALTVSSLPAASPEALREQSDALQARLAKTFTVVIEPPFIVAGDESPRQVRQRAADTVRWAVDRLKADFFDKDPDEIITIWLFKDARSYGTHCREMFGEEPPSPYGYYSARHQALIMNIATGGGTLVHEIVHPYVRANFPNCPAWFNEGLGSLFEQSAEKDGHIVGLPNWRLPPLQQLLREEKMMPFESFTAMSDAEFYGGSTGYSQHYAQARYLCHYLQEHGLLRKFYREFRKNAADDPTGFNTLKTVLRTDDMLAFEERWKAFVLKLHYARN